MRFFIQFSYFGSAYHGWQKQPNAITVQTVLEEALSKLMRSNIILMGAGRTDAGVHAKEMYAHFDAEKIVDISDLIFRLNSFLPNDIAVQNIMSVSDSAHARFDATERTYEYLITQKKNVFLTDRAHYIKHALDINKMNRASALLLEQDNFECFSKSNTEVKTYRCDVKYAQWQWQNDTLVFTITADRFLRNMVRAIVGTLLEVGLGRSDIENVKRILKSKDRTKAGTSMPAKGLYLTRVSYPENTLNLDG